MEKVGRTVDEICAATGGAATRQEVWKIQSKIRRDMGIVVGHVTPEEVVTRIGRASKQSGEVIEKARQACQAVVANDIFTAQAPQLIASAVLVMTALVSNSQISLTDVSRASISCSTQQICKTYTSLHAYADLILSKHCLGDFDLIHLPEMLVLGPAPATRKQTKKNKNMGGRREDIAKSTTIFANNPASNNWEAQVAKVASAPRIDSSKPRTRANSLVDVEREDDKVVAPLFPKKRDRKSSKTNKRKLAEASEDPQGGTRKAPSAQNAEDKANRGPTLSPVGSLVSLNSIPMSSSGSEIGSTNRGDDGTSATAAAASYLLARSSSDSSSKGRSSSRPVSHRSRQGPWMLLSKHSSPLFRDMPKPTKRHV